MPYQQINGSILEQETEGYEKLRKLEESLLKKNLFYKKRYYKLLASLQRVCAGLEQNARVLTELLDDAKSAVKLYSLPSKIKNLDKNGTMGEVAGGKVSTNLPHFAVHVANKKKGFKQVENWSNEKRREELRQARRNIQLEPLNLTKIQEAIDVGPELEEVEFSVNQSTEGLTTISEESTVSNKSRRDIVINITRLSTEVMQSHLNKLNASKLDETWDFDRSVYANGSSTPYKIQCMKSIGLVPVEELETLKVQKVKRQRNVIKRIMHCSPDVAKRKLETSIKKKHDLKLKQKKLFKDKPKIQKKNKAST